MVYYHGCLYIKLITQVVHNHFKKHPLCTFEIVEDQIPQHPGVEQVPEGESGLRRQAAVLHRYKTLRWHVSKRGVKQHRAMLSSLQHRLGTKASIVVPKM